MTDDVQMEGDPTPDTEFDDELLTNVDKWWEFLDPVTYGVNDSAHARGVPAATADRLDWTAVREADRQVPVGFGFFHRCEDCGKSVPPDVTFCVHCGGQPAGFHAARPFTLLIKSFEDEQAKDRAIEVLRRGSGEVDVGELRRVLGQLPAVFNLHARKEQVAALVARMADVGIYSKSFPMDDPSVPWISETAESLVREPRRGGMAAAIIVLAVLGTIFWSFASLFFGVIAFGFFFNAQMQWFKGRYNFSAYDMLNGVTGMDAGRAYEAADLLKSLRDESIRGSLTVALMEFYILHKTLQSHVSMYGRAMAGTQDTLVELLDEILRACARFRRIEEFLEQARPTELETRIRRIKKEYHDSDDPETKGYLKRELAAVQEQLKTYRRLEEVRDGFRDRLKAMTRSLEALRARLETARANMSARWEDIPLDKVLAELDDDLVVFQQTFEELEMAAPAMTVGR